MSNKKPVGRPKVKERKVSDTISILPSKKKRIEKLYGSTTKFVEAMILTNNI